MIKFVPPSDDELRARGVLPAQEEVVEVKPATKAKAKAKQPKAQEPSDDDAN